jgi:hypothetical protein
VDISIPLFENKNITKFRNYADITFEIKNA